MSNLTKDQRLKLAGIAAVLSKTTAEIKQEYYEDKMKEDIQKEIKDSFNYYYEVIEKVIERN